VGFDWEQPEQVVEKLDEELQELREAASHHQSIEASSSQEQDTLIALEAIEQEFGDVLFTVANLARFLKVNPEEALRKSCNRFVARFATMEQQAVEAGKGLQQLSTAEWETFWEVAKKHERSTPSASSERSDQS
jgi:XTP/dITP diphosphohydrolase